VLEAHIEAFESRTAAKAEEVGQALTNLIARVDQGIDSRAQVLSETMTGRASRSPELLEMAVAT